MRNDNLPHDRAVFPRFVWLTIHSTHAQEIQLPTQRILTINPVKYGMGRHFTTLTPYEKLTSAKPFWASIVIYNLGLFLCKFSILLQYLRIFPYRLFRIFNYALMAFIFAWSCWTVFSAVFFCRPVEFFWDKEIEGGTCLSQWTTWYGYPAS